MLWIRVLIAGAVAALYGPTLLDMAHEWRTDTYAAHGMFVPLFAAHLLWTDRQRLREAVGPSDRLGIAVLAAAAGLLVMTHDGPSLVLRGASFVIALTGMVLLFFGREWLRVAAFPMAFLLLMVPLPHALVAKVTAHLQLFAAGFAGSVLQVVGVPSYQQGIYLFLPSITLEIAEICNGLRFLMALLVLTLAFAELALPTPLRKVLLVLSVFPVAILANAARVAVVALAAHYWGPEAASGPLHHAIGKLVWVLTLVPMGMIAIGLRRFPTRAELPEDEEVRELTEPAR